MNNAIKEQEKHKNNRTNTKVIISARTKRHGLHIGKILSNHWRDGLAGGHRELAGGQIPFESILSEVPNDLDQAIEESLEETIIQLKQILPSPDEE